MALPSSQEEPRTLKISCGCGQVTGHAVVASSKLPLHLTPCHCNSCRHVSGLLCITWVELPQGSSLYIQGGIQSYHSSSDCTRYFCPRCGCHTYFTDRRNNLTALCSGTVGNAEIFIGDVKDNVFVADTKDGGMSVWLPDAAQWAEWSSGRRWHVSKAVPPLHEAAMSTDDKLHAKCHCGGVNFYITRPDVQSENLHSPWPDLLVPYQVSSSDNPDNVKWWIRANGTKYLAGTCACKSCCLSSGSDFQTWAFIPRSNILQEDGRPLDFAIGTLKRYDSSEGCHRDFCGTCGAAVFWSGDQRPELIDVSAGLFESQNGARAEDWLDWWTERVSFEQDASHKPSISALKIGLKTWTQKGAA